MRLLWRRTVSTATTSLTRKTAKIAHTAPRSGPTSAVFRAALSAEQSPRCTPGLDQMCHVAVGSFANVGHVRYYFNDTRRNIRGSSNQVMIACRCLSRDCALAILVRPVEIVTRSPDGKLQPSGKKTCLYESVQGKFSDCYSEALRISYKNRESTRKLDDPNEFNYTVNDDYHGDYWTALGRRGTIIQCLDTDIEQLPRANLSEIKSQDVRFNEHRSGPRGDTCGAKGNVQVHRSAVQRDDEDCVTSYDTSMSVSAHTASQQDCYAVGKVEGTYLQPTTLSLVSDTELTLSSSAGVLGIIFLGSLYFKLMKKSTCTYAALWVAVILQCLSYALEALPLHIALGSEITASNWVSLFAFVDATQASHADGTKNGIIIITAVVGEVRHHTTRVMTIAVLTAVFDMLAISCVLLTILRKHHSIASQRRQRQNLPIVNCDET